MLHPAAPTESYASSVALLESPSDQLERALLAADYGVAQASGLLNYFRPGAVGHILAGELRTTFDGCVRVARGYHHEPSGRLWQSGDNSAQAVTGVLLTDSGEHPALGDPRRPYLAAVRIGGVVRTALRRCGPARSTELVPSLNTMFPYGMRALDVLQAIATAFIHRNRRTEALQGDSVVSVGVAPASPTAEELSIKVVWDLCDETIITAAPLLEPMAVKHGASRYAGFLRPGGGSLRT